MQKTENKTYIFRVKLKQLHNKFTDKNLRIYLYVNITVQHHGHAFYYFSIAPFLPSNEGWGPHTRENVAWEETMDLAENIATVNPDQIHLNVGLKIPVPSFSHGVSQNSYFTKSAGNRVVFDPKPNWCIKGCGTVWKSFRQNFILIELPQTFLDLDCGTLLISGEAQIPKLILPFSAPFTLPGCCFCQSLSPSPSLSLSDSPFPYIYRFLHHFSSHSLFLYCCLLNSPIAFYSLHTRCTSAPASWDPVLSLLFPRPLYLSLSSSLTLFLSFLFWPEGERSKCLLEEQDKQFVYATLLLFHTNPTGGHAALIVDEMSHIHVILAHMNYTK